MSSFQHFVCSECREEIPYALRRGPTDLTLRPIVARQCPRCGWTCCFRCDPIFDGAKEAHNCPGCGQFRLVWLFIEGEPDCWVRGGLRDQWEKNRQSGRWVAIRKALIARSWREERRVGVPPKSFPPTGDPYVDDSLTLQYQEVYDDRRSEDVPEMRKVVSLGNEGRIDEAIKLAESLLSKYADWDFVYVWLGFLHTERGEYDKTRAVLKDGLKKSKKKYSLFNSLGRTELKAQRLTEAVRWWIQSVLSQTTIGDHGDYEPFLYLAYVSQFFGLSQVALLLFQKVDAIRQIRLVESAQQDLYKLVSSQGTESMRRALIELNNRYLSKKTPS